MAKASNSGIKSQGRQEAESKATRNYKIAINSTIKSLARLTTQPTNIYREFAGCLVLWRHGKQNRHGLESQIVVRAMKKEQEL